MVSFPAWLSPRARNGAPSVWRGPDPPLVYWEFASTCLLLTGPSWLLLWQMRSLRQDLMWEAGLILGLKSWRGNPLDQGWAVSTEGRGWRRQRVEEHENKAERSSGGNKHPCPYGPWDWHQPLNRGWRGPSFLYRLLPCGTFTTCPSPCFRRWKCPLCKT